jgi:hypothetical protein
LAASSRGVRRLAGGAASAPRPDVVARGQQLRDVALGVQDALALHFGRVGGQHRRHISCGQGLATVLRRDAGPAQARQRHVDAAFLRVAGALVDGAAADVVAVFGQVGQVAEIGEGADHAHRLVAAQALEQLLERRSASWSAWRRKGDRQLADLLDQLEGVHAVLVADHVTQDAPSRRMSSTSGRSLSRAACMLASSFPP